MSLEENKALCNRGAEAINRGDFDAIDEIYAPDNAQKLKEMLTEVRRAFPDFYGMNVIQIAEGDLVLNRTSCTVPTWASSKASLPLVSE
jgi:hypothetical protein